MIRIFVLLALVVSISAHAQTTITTAGQPASLWAVAPSEKGSIDTAALERLRAEGINALVVNAQSSRVARVLALHALAKQMKMWLVVIVPQRSQTPAARRALALCRGHAPNIRCAGLAGSVGRARTMAHHADIVRPFVALYRVEPHGGVAARDAQIRPAPRRRDRPALQELQRFGLGTRDRIGCDLAGRRPCNRSRGRPLVQLHAELRRHARFREDNRRNAARRHAAEHTQRHARDGHDVVGYGLVAALRG